MTKLLQSHEKLVNADWKDIDMSNDTLSGAELDLAIAKIEGEKGRIIQTSVGDLLVVGTTRRVGIEISYSPSSDWSQGGTLIEKYQISLNPEHKGLWVAGAKDNHYRYGATPLIAAMRAIVAAYGDKQ